MRASVRFVTRGRSRQHERSKRVMQRQCRLVNDFICSKLTGVPDEQKLDEEVVARVLASHRSVMFVCAAGRNISAQLRQTLAKTAFSVAAINAILRDILTGVELF